MRRPIVLAVVLVLAWPSAAFAELPLQWQAVPASTPVANIKGGTTWNPPVVTYYTDSRFGYVVTYQAGRTLDYAGGDGVDGMLSTAPTTQWVMTPLASPSQAGTYTAVSEWSASIYRGDGTTKSLRVWPILRFDVERRNPPAATETVVTQAQSMTGYWPDQAAPQYSLDATTSGSDGLDYRYTNDTVPCDQLRDAQGDIEPVTSRGILLVTYRPRAGANVWDVYYGFYGHVSGSSATDYRASVGSFTVNASTAATAYAPTAQVAMRLYVPSWVRLADPQGVPPSYAPAALVSGDVLANLSRESYYSATSSASDRVASFLAGVEGRGWGNMLSEPPTTSVPPTQSVPATATTPTIPATTTPSGDWYAVITNAVAPLRSLLWPLDLFGRLAGK